MSRPKTVTRFNSHEPEPEFKRLRKAAKLSQEQLSRYIGVAVSTIRRWEKGKCEPTFTLKQFRLFCDAVNQTINTLPSELSRTTCYRYLEYRKVKIDS